MVTKDRDLVAGPLSGHVGGFAEDLVRQQYSPGVARRHVQVMRHLSGWMECAGVAGSDLDTVWVEAYLRARRDAGSVRALTREQIEPVIGYLRRVGAAPPAPVVPPGYGSGPLGQLLEAYAVYLHGERGLRDERVQCLLGWARGFLQEVGVERGEGLDLSGLSASRVNRLVLAGVAGSSRPRAGELAGALRALLRFLHVTGMVEESLVGAVPSMASWRQAGIPQGLTGEQVVALLAACDRTSVSGRRNYAVLTVLARLGLRAGEVAALRLPDVDWRAGTMRVHGKGNHTEVLPLPSDVGEAITDYLRAGHPGSSVCDALFVRVHAPTGGLTAGAVTQIVASAAHRAGLGTIHAHRLRHTAATAILRSGGSLEEVGQLLAHRRSATTTIYAKVDLDALRSITRPWPAQRSTCATDGVLV